MPLYLGLAAGVIGQLLLVVLALLQSPWLAVIGLVLMLIWIPFALRELHRG